MRRWAGVVHMTERRDGACGAARRVSGGAGGAGADELDLMSLLPPVQPAGAGSVAPLARPMMGLATSAPEEKDAAVVTCEPCRPFGSCNGKP